MFTSFTQDGLPPDFAFDIICDECSDLTDDERINIVGWYQLLKIKHDITSGMTEKNVEKAKARNLKVMFNFIRSGDLDTI